ncbi:MAG: PilT/PilU family type 4a pilus ATPase [Polyangiaceae bacterium]|nr:PilT/PilU family type 4a pilus ATPase [Polyangiaceae bacterium]
MDGFVASVESTTAAEVSKLLGVILDLRPRSTPHVHSLRCHAFASLATRFAGPEIFAPGLKALAQSDPALRDVLVAVLPRSNDVNAHDVLCDALGNASPEVRAAAAEVLKQVGGRTALEILVRRALDPAFVGRLEAMNALLARAGSQALPLLAATLRAGKPLEKIHALRALGSKERFAKDLRGATEAATIGLADRDDLVVAQAITTLGLLDVENFVELTGPRIENRGLDVLRAFCAQAARRLDDGISDLFRQKMRDGPKAVRLLLLDVVEAEGREPLFPMLVDALSNRDVGVRTRAAQAIVTLSKNKAIDAARAIVWLLRSRDTNVRRVAADIAQRVGDADGTLAPKLLGYLRDEDWWVRERILDALVEMNGSGLTKHIISVYLGDSSDVVRRFAVSALLRIADPRALGALVRTAQNDSDWLVSELAVEAIGRLSDLRAVDYLVDLLQRRPELRVATIGALRELRAEAALPAVAELVYDEDPDVRGSAIQLLDELDDGTHALWVKGCEDDPSPAVREVAGRLLRRFQLSRSGPPEAAELKSIDALLSHAAAQNADDLFLQADRPPFLKRLGKVEPLGSTPISGASILELLKPIMTPDQRVMVEQKRDVDFSYTFASRGLRFRVNVFAQLTGPAAVFRSVKEDVLTMDKLGIPSIVASFANLPHGLVLVGGPTGAGKSTTLAALIDHINRTTARHIVTIEDPIEVVHTRVKSLVNQREIGSHTRSFANALRATLRQDPDVILVGELRDLETIAFAVSAAETGHLVLGTVHTTTADATIDRLINAFPARQQPQIRSMVAESLRAVTCQHLLRGPSGGRRVLAVEVMVNNDAIQSLVRKGKTFQIPTIIAMSRDQGMQLMDGELIRLAKEGRVDIDDAHAKSIDKRAFEAALGLPPSDESSPSMSTPPPSGRISGPIAKSALPGRR